MSEQLRSWHYRPSHPALQDYVEGFVLYRFGKEGTLQKQHFLPEGIVEIILQRAPNSWYLAHPNAKNWQQRPQNFVGGLHRRSYQVSWDGMGEALGIRFKPGAFAHFCPIAVHQLKDTLVDIAELWGSAAHRWMKDIQGQSVQHKIGISEVFLIEQLMEQECPQFDFAAAYQYLLSHQGHIQVERMAQASCYSIAHFRHLFSKHFGLSPKAYSRLYRLRQAVKAKPSKLSLTDWAHQLGYFDQAHFNRDIKAFTGKTPKESLAVAYYG